MYPIGRLSISSLPAVLFDGVYRVLACHEETEESCAAFPRFGSNMAAPLDPSQWMEIDLQWYKNPIWDQAMTSSCFPAGTPILMADGTERPIEEIGVGNEVLTHLNEPHAVTDIMERSYTGTLYRLKVKGWAYPLVLTEEHPICIVKDERIAWVAAKDVTIEDRVMMPRGINSSFGYTIHVKDYVSDCFAEGNTCRLFKSKLSGCINSKIKVDDNFARLIGLFLAEGSHCKNCYGSSGGINFTFAIHEKEYQEFVIKTIKEIFGVDAVYRYQRSRPSVMTIQCLNSTLGQFFYNFCGESKYNKFINTIFFRSGESVKINLLRGWLEGDGTQNPIKIRKNKNHKPSLQIDGVTVSPEIHRGMFRLALSVGLKPGGQVRKQEKHQTVPARVITFYSDDVIKLFPTKEVIAVKAGWESSGRVNYQRHKLGFACKIDNISKTECRNLKVYNLEVDEDHTYIANGIAVHNCVGQGITAGGQVCYMQSGRPLTEFNPYFLYGLINGGRDAGAMISDGLKAFMQHGTCPKADLQPGMMFRNQFPQKAFDNAKRFKLVQAYKCGNFNDICSAITLGFVCPLGIYVDQNFSRLDDEGVAGMPSSMQGGGHCILGMGLKKSSRYGWLIKIQNSWGNRFGINGYAYIHKGHFQKMNPDAFAIQSIMDDPQDNTPADDVPIMTN